MYLFIEYILIDTYRICTCFIEEKRGNKYLNITCTDRNSEILKKYAEYGVELQIKLKK